MLSSKSFVVNLVASLCVVAMADHLDLPNSTQVNFRSAGVNLLISFEALVPKGLRITVVLDEGIDYFTFNGKINLPIRVKETGTLTWQVIPRGERRVTKEFPDIQLLTGDVINYWTGIQYKGVALQSESLPYIVKDLVPTSSVSSSSDQRPVPAQAATTRRPNPAANTNPSVNTEQPCSCRQDTLDDVWARLNASVGEVLLLRERIIPLQEQLSTLTEALDELTHIQDVGTTLLLTGNLPVRTNPVEDVRHLLIEKLNLRDLSTKILQAEYKKNDIFFEMATSIDKLRILKRSKDILSKLSYRIVDPNRPAFDVRSN